MFIVEKIAGALAERGASLAEIKNYVEEHLLAPARIVTLGVSLSGRVSLPGETAPVQSSTSSEFIEVGLGIHGEAGHRRIPMCSSRELAALALRQCLSFLADGMAPSTLNGQASKQTGSPRQICLRVNNLGGLSVLELHAFVKDCVEHVHAEWSEKFRMARLYCGTFMTSLNMGKLFEILN